MSVSNEHHHHEHHQHGNLHRPDIHSVLPNPSFSYVIGVAGGTSSGKSWLVDVLRSKFQDDVMTIPQDAFYRTATPRTNFDHPDSIEFDLLIECVKQARAGNDIQIPVYDFATHSRTDDVLHLKAKPIVIVEGILVMTNAKLTKLCDLNVYVHAELDTMYRRRSKRDQVERGRDQESIDTQWDTFVKPMHLQYVLPSKDRAEIVINNDRHQILDDPDSIVQIRIMVTYIDSYLAQLSDGDSASNSTGDE
jgi:uridine kinase